MGNQLTTLPPEIATLVNLKTLDLSRNQISEIPECIGQLSNLFGLSAFRFTCQSLTWSQVFVKTTA
ncbi:MAG: leucine-rich repeat domain-containing protein [Microcoleaceae cyanobacterium]